MDQFWSCISSKRGKNCDTLFFLSHLRNIIKPPLVDTSLSGHLYLEDKYLGRIKCNGINTL